MGSDDSTSAQHPEDEPGPSRPSEPTVPTAESERRRRRGVGRAIAAFFRWDGWAKVGSVATAVTALSALWFTAQSLRSTRDQYGLSEKGQVTDRFSRAVDNLGSDKVNVRLGGIYSLERLARDSAEDQPTIIEILSAFVRTQAPADGPQCAMPELVPSGNPYLAWRYSGPLPELQVDVQAAVTVIGRRDPHHDAGSLPDLSASCLARVHVQGSFAGANFEGTKLGLAFFEDTDLTCAGFPTADLSLAIFNGERLVGANLFLAKAIDAQFGGADLRGANLGHADLRDANLVGADLENADLSGATLTDARLRGGETLSGEVSSDTNLTGSHFDDETKWPVDYRPPASTELDVARYQGSFQRAECLRNAEP